jgi:hypothetical protein
MKHWEITFTTASFNHWKKSMDYRNTPYADPEAGLSSGNVQGYQSGAYLLLEKLEQVLNYSFKK